jgi:serine/threonine protein phosphatase PrpC
MKVSFSAKSDLGLKRKTNEDSFLADEGMGLFMVLDGIGGHLAGEVASKLGLNTIKENVMRSLTGKWLAESQNLSRELQILNESLVLANKVIYEAANSQPEYFGMGTTVASLLLGCKNIAIAHVGDSRIYLIRENSIERLTEDHSLVVEQLKRGIISAEEAEKSGMKNVITRALGAEELLTPTVDELIPFSNDLFLICSDGLTDLVTDDEILEIILKSRHLLDHAVQNLIDKANEKGGKDNITAMLISIKCRSRKKLTQYLFSALDRVFSWLRVKRID